MRNEGCPLVGAQAEGKLVLGALDKHCLGSPVQAWPSLGQSTERGGEGTVRKGASKRLGARGDSGCPVPR